MQRGFTCKGGNLYIPGACDIIDPANSFLRQVPGDLFDYVFIILDTHYAEEYLVSEEGKMFPIHCEFGTSDWELSVDISGLPKKRFLMKNQFDLWSNRAACDIHFADEMKRTAYQNLFHFVDDPRNSREKYSRDSFISSIIPSHNPALVEVTLFGVASDFCNRYAMEGWLNRGVRVTILKDLTKGIQKETLSVIEECKYHTYIPERLRTITSTDYLRELLLSQHNMAG